MGCASSKSKQTRCKRCDAPYSPVTRSYSMHTHHPPSKEGDSYHVVALTSTTLGSLGLEHSSSSPNPLGHLPNGNGHVVVEEDGADEKKSKKKEAEFEVGMIEAKAWSKLIDEKITKVVPRTPIRTPPGEPETINAWEMMEGLEDISPLRPVASVHHLRSFSFHVSPNDISDLMEYSPPRRETENGFASTKPIWMESPDEDDDCHSNKKLISKTIASELDPEVISAFRKAFQELSPSNPFRLSKQLPKTQHENAKPNGTVADIKVENGLPEKKANGVLVTDLGFANERKLNGSMEKGAPEDQERIDAISLEENKCAKERLVLYFTSLRGVRKTYEDCCNVRLILKGLGVRVDERDVSMHSGFKEELKELLGESYGGGLPRVFVGDNYIGGAEEIQIMHEEGKLENVLEGCELIEDEGDGSLGVGGTCEACGDVRFIPCETCSGSCKIYYEVDEEEDEEQYENGEFGFQRCPDCNENGLIRCPICCY